MKSSAKYQVIKFDSSRNCKNIVQANELAKLLGVPTPKYVYEPDTYNSFDFKEVIQSLNNEQKVESTRNDFMKKVLNLHARYSDCIFFEFIEGATLDDLLPKMMEKIDWNGIGRILCFDLLTGNSDR